MMFKLLVCSREFHFDELLDSFGCIKRDYTSSAVTMVITGTNSEICSELERLFLRLALINDDSKLEAFIRKHLLDIIHCTSTGEVEVRNKGMELLTHLNLRVKNNLTIALPLKDILHYLLSLAEGNILATNFAIIYLKIALDRVDTNEHITLLPSLLDGLLKYLNNRKIFNHIIVLTARAWISIASVKQQEWPSLKSLKNKTIRSEIMKFFSDVLYFPISSSESRNMAVMLNNFPDHPCMSRNGFLRIAKDVIVDLKVNIISLKLSIIKVLSSIFTEAEILPLLIGATANGPSEVEIAGDVAIKKIDLQKVLRNKDTVNSLFNLYLGLSLQKLDEGDKVLPATVPIKLKLMPLLMKSLVGIQTFPNNIKIAFDGLFSKENSVQNIPLKLQQGSIDFLLLIVKNFPVNALSTFGPIIFSSIRKLINQNEFSSVVAVAYQCFGIIGSKVPQLVLNDMALLQETFDAIPLAPEEVSFAIADCLVSWLPVFCTVNDVALIGVLETIISSYIVHSPKCRLVALKFVETLVKTSSLEFRWILCQACEDPRDEMKHEAVRLLDLSIADPTMTPKFEDLVAFMHRKLNLQDASGETANFSTAEAKKKKKEFADEVFYISSFYLLEAFIRKHLLDIIHCTSTGEVEVRNKGMELLTHLNLRVKNNLTIALPLKDILHYLLSLAEGNILATNFAIIYLKIALDRVDTNEHITLLPSLLDGLLKYLNNRKIFNHIIVLTARAWISIASVKQQEWPSLKSLKNKTIRSEIMKFFSDVLYFPISSSESRNMAVMLNNFPDHPCMSRNGFLRIAKDVIVDLKVNIISLKLSIIKVLSSIFTEAEILPLLIGATANGPSEVEIAGDVAIKKIDLQKVLRNKDTVNSLFNLYLGLSLQKLDEGDKVLPATVPIKLKLMPLLMKSLVGIQTFPNNIKIAFDGLFSKENSVQNIPLKLQQGSIDFLLLIVKNFPVNALSTFGPIIFSSIRKLINQNEFSSVVAVAYQCFGIIGSKVPQLVLNDMALLQETFDAIPLAPEEVSFAIADCLVSWLPVFCTVNDVALIGVLETIISSYIVHSPKCRLVALKFVETLVKTSSLEFRWILCQACEDPRDEMKHEAVRLLDLSIADPTMTPKFEDLVAFMHRKLNLQDASGETANFSTAEAKKKKKEFADEVFYISSFYLYANLQVACSLQPLSLAEADVFSRTSDYPVISKYLLQISEKQPEILRLFLEIVLKAIEIQPANFLIEMACLFLHNGSSGLNHNYRAIIAAWLERHLNSNSRITVCAKLSQLYSLILNDIERKKCLKRCIEQFDDRNELPLQIPWLCVYLATQPAVDLIAEEINEIKIRLLNIIETLSVQQYFEAACGSLAELLRRAVFGLSEVEKTVLVSSVSDNQFCSFCELLGRIAASRKDILTSKMKESAVRCLGFLSLHNLPSTLYEKILAQLFACGEIATQPEFQFIVGNALFDAAFSESSPSRRNMFTETEECFIETNLSVAKRDNIEKRVANLLEILLTVKLHHTNRHLRQAAFIWLFTLVKRCAITKLNCIMNNLSSIQHAFISGLAETNESSQQLASEGLGIIFELSSEEQKKRMVEELISTLSVGRKRVDPVSPDTRLFGKGELGNTPSGENLTTYQELCNLATDLNQPDLIYKFMQLANHNIFIIIQQAESAVKPYLAQLVPKLYRYRYDPDLKVQSAMRSIWQAVTVSKKSVTEEYADAIFNELILTLTDSQWRMRESSCLALADLLSGYCTDKIVERFGQLFEILYRVQDDVKDSVRVAAGRALSSLIKITVHKCSSVNGAKATRLLGTVLPVIAEKGIGSSVKINKILSLKIIMDIVKEAGLALQEHINIIIPCLLDSLSEEESTFLNYLAARSSLDELEVLDSARMSVAHSSPMMSTLRYIVPYVNENIFNFLGDKLMEQLRSSIGVTTRTGTCQFIIDLCLQRQQLLMSCRSSCDRMVRVLLNGLSDPNPVIKKQFSSCLSYLLPFSSKKEVNQVMDYIKQKLRSERDDEKMTVLHLLRALSRNTELLSESLSVVVPFIFLYKCQEVAKNDEAGKKKLEMWDELWSELVPDTSSAMRLYRNEMIELALVTLNTSSVFSIKAQAAKVLEIISGSGVISDDVDYAEILYDNLTNALRGRIWNGKEKLIEAISALLRSAGKNLVLKWDEITVEAKFLLLWEQCSKKNEKYSGEAILCAAVFCEMTACNKIAEQVMSYICDVMNYNHSKSNFDDTTSETSNTNHSKTCDYLTKIAPAISHLLLSFDGAELFDRIKQTVTLLKSNIFWKVKQALVIELPYFIERCTTQVDFTALFVVIGSLLTENDISQRRTFAQQCCGVLEYVVKRAQKKECILALHNHKDMVEILKKTTIVKSSALLDDLLKWEM
ncbi:Proteasome adapter and scaffold protein [Dirofilaria immitis]